MITHKPRRLTRYPEGSMGEVMFISVPLMIQILSGTLMYFLDRVILAHYSTEAMNAAATASMTCAVLQYLFIGVAAMSEVFVGQNNGASHYKELGIPVWQMIWFSLSSSLIFIPSALFLGPVLLPDEVWDQGLGYYQWIMFFGFLMPLITAISGFFIGQGKVKFVTAVVVLGNLLNLGLDILLVFGFENIIQPMGPVGAAIATVISLLTQFVILFLAFMRKKYREEYGTNLFHFKKPVFLKALKIGFPAATGHMLEITAWAFILNMMANISEVHLTVMTIGQSLLILFFFVIDGLNKGVIAIVSNQIGSANWDKVQKVLLSGVQFHALLVLFLSVPLLMFPEQLIHLFLTEKTVLDTAEVIALLKKACFWVWVYFLFDGITWVLASALTAAGDTKFVMCFNAFNAWFFALLPVYIFVVLLDYPPDTAWFIISFYGLMNACMCYWRFKVGYWKKIKLTEEVSN